METLEIEKDGKKEIINLKNLKGRHTKQGLKKLLAIQDEDGSENLSKLSDYLDYLDTIACDCTGMTQDDLDDLDTEEKNKIISQIQSKVMDSWDFLKSSLNVANSSAKAKDGQ